MSQQVHPHFLFTTQRPQKLLWIHHWLQVKLMLADLYQVPLLINRILKHLLHNFPAVLWLVAQNRKNLVIVFDLLPDTQHQPWTQVSYHITFKQLFNDPLLSPLALLFGLDHNSLFFWCRVCCFEDQIRNHWPDLTKSKVFIVFIHFLNPPQTCR